MKLHYGICQICNLEYSRPRPLRSPVCSKKCRKLLDFPIETLQCKTCNQEFVAKQYKSRKFCSIECHNKDKEWLLERRLNSSLKRTKTCNFCGKIYIKHQSGKEQKFCSTKCAYTGKHPISDVTFKNCILCNKLFNQYYKEQLCCSKTCAGLYRFKLKKPDQIAMTYKSYKNHKRYLLSIYNGCMICGYNEHIEILELHHINRNRHDNKPENLILICPNCYSWNHYQAKDGQFKNNLGKKQTNLIKEE
jgi:hypothetical protein